MSASDDVEREENILYDLTIAAEWPQEPETINRNVREKFSLKGRLTSVAYRTLWTFLRSIGISMRTASPCNLPIELVRLVNNHIYWHLAVSRDGRHLAILQDQLLEIRSSRDDFGVVVGRCPLSVDPHPQWRSTAWGHSGDMVACSGSAGDVNIFDIAGASIVYIPSTVVPSPDSPVDLSHAVVGLIFKEYNTKSKGDDLWQEELLVINYQGALHSYLISLDGTFCLNHTYTFSSHYPRGLSCSVYLPTHDLLVLGGPAAPGDTSDTGPLTYTDCGLSLWRGLSDFPYYKTVTDYEQDTRATQANFVNRLRNLTFPSLAWRRQNGQDGIFHLSCSLDGQLMSAIHYSGNVSVWYVPSFRLSAIWPLEEQPGYDESNPEIMENPRLRKQMKDSLKAYHLMDANWWSNEAMIMVRGTGALTVSSVKTLRNLLGTSPEWFSPAPVVSPAIDGGFMALECETKLSSAKRRMVEDKDDPYEDSDDELDFTMVTKTTRYVKWVLHYVTDMERFQPPRKRPKIMNKTYRLINLKSTTPEELYHRKIEHEEYGEALALAKLYGLDCDLVYQRQWRKTPVSVASIQDYLSKISKRSWVLNDCMERVPENIDAMRDLLQYGLRGTDLEALQAIGRNEDGGRFILCDTQAAYEDSLDFLDEDALEEAKEQEAERRRELAAEVDFSKLSLEQRELCRARLKLLQYLDRLATYEEILGGIHAAEERFDPKFFEDFRSKNIVELAINYARQCDWRALEVLLTYHGSELLKHRLAILSNFPETFAPSEYRSLLPEAGWRPDEAEVLVWEEGSRRLQDWVEMEECRCALNPDRQDPGAFLYEDNPDLDQFMGEVLTREQLTAWYTYRAEQIERLSRQVEHSLELVRYGMERNVDGLTALCDDLITMDTLVYECLVDDAVTFEDLQAMEDIDKLRLIMSTSTEEMYIKNVRRWLVPFLQRVEKHAPGTFSANIRQYLVTLAKDNLTACRKVFESSKADQPNPVISVDNELISMALECIYACESDDQLSNAFGILECLPQRGFGVVSEASTRLHNQVDELECHLSAAETLEKHGLPQTIADIRASQHDSEEAKKLFTKLTRLAGRKTPPLTAPEWEELLVSMLDLRDKVYRCVQPNVCYEIFVESLLCSSRPENIRLAGERMERSMAEASEPDYPPSDRDDAPLLHKVAYPQAVDLVLSAAQEYFNSSAALTDNCMELARQCLNLIVDQPAAVTEELDLIESLALLAGFGVSMLPLQVRMTSERLDLIQKAIDAKPFTYKNSQRLLRLARLLRVKGNNEREREGQVLKLVAQASLKAKDQRVAHDTCKRLMEAGYAPVWEECKALAQDEAFTDTKAKVDLLSFAVTHCSEDMLEPILRAKCFLETQILYDQLQQHGGGAGSEGTSPTRETSPFSARAALTQTQEILSATTSTTRTVLSAVSDKKWWQRTMKSLHPASHQANLTEEWDDRNATFTRQGCHPFYADLMDAAYKNNTEADYRRLRLRPAVINGLQFSEAVLHLACLEQMLTEGATDNSTTAVLLQLAEDVIHQDCSLGLSYLLALPQPLDADPVFKKLPRTAISLQLATYYYALQLGARLSPATERHQGSLYTHDPADVIVAMLAVTENGGAALRGKKKALPEVVEGLVERLHHYNELMTDFTQAQVLENLSKGVDVARFTQDSEYKRETILGLAMTTEQTVYETALSLAKRYKLPLWELYMTHLEHLFDCGLPLGQLEERVVQQGLMHALSQQPADLYQRLSQYVYPSIAGTDHGRLLYYYSLLDEAQVPEHGITPDTHIRLLKKIRPAAPGLDYKRLMDGTQRPLEVIRPILNDGNVHVLAKLAPKIPDQKGGFLQPSLVFCAWAVKMFWGTTSSSRGQPHNKVKQYFDKSKVEIGHPQKNNNKAEWIHRYEACGEYMQKLNPDDLAQFVEAIVFVPQSLDKLELGCRQDIVRRAIKFCKQGGKKKKREENTRSELSWDDVAVRMQHSLDHLNNLDNPVIAELAESEDEQLRDYARLFDLSRSETDKVHELCVRMVLDGQSCQQVADVLSILPRDTWQPQTAVKEAISLIVTAIRNPDDVPSLLEGRDLMKTLETVIHSVNDNQDSDLVSVDDVMTLLRPFCADVTVPVQPRLDVLHILEQAFELNDGDLILLICYRTDAIISTGWHGRKVTEGEVGTDAGRQALFDDLLSTSEQLTHFTALTKLLDVWPPLPAMELRSEEPELHPWCQMIVAMVTHCKQDAVPHVLKITENLKSSKPLSIKCVRFLFDTLVGADMWLAAIKVALISGHTELHDDVLQQLSNHHMATDDPALSELLLQHHLVARIVNTLYYPLVVDYVISRQTPGEQMPYYMNVETIANQLQELGHVAEAGSLLMTYRGTHPMLRTFDMTYSVLSRWFTKS